MYDNYGHNQQSPQTPPTPQKIVRFDNGYVTTMPGIVKMVQLLSNVCGYICIKVAWGIWISSIFWNILYWIGITITGFLLLVYTFHVVEKFDQWAWLKLEFLYCCAMSFTYIILSILATTIGDDVGYAVGFFGLCAILAYGFDAYLKYKAWKRGLPPQSRGVL